MKRFLLYACFPAMLLASCNNSNSQSAPSKVENNNEKDMKTSSNYKNHIRIRENGLKVEQAVLLKEGGEPLGEDNKVGIGEQVYCRLIVSGWKEENGRVKLGAAETIFDNEGKIVTQDEDIFKDLTDASATDARIITLTAKITTLHKSIHEFKVNFRVWDKVSNAALEGTFPFYLK